MKKLLLVTGIFLSLGMVASAQQKKPTAPAIPVTQTKENKKSKMTREQQVARKKGTHASKHRIAAPASKETQVTAQ